MRVSRLIVIAAFGAFAIVQSCGGETIESADGNAGTSGDAGEAGAAGTSNGGASGESGQAGRGGTRNAGSGGSDGMPEGGAGTGGEGGISNGGEGGVPIGGEGGAGNAGESGAGGAGGSTPGGSSGAGGIMAGAGGSPTAGVGGEAGARSGAGGTGGQCASACTAEIGDSCTSRCDCCCREDDPTACSLFFPNFATCREDGICHRARCGNAGMPLFNGQPPSRCADDGDCCSGFSCDATLEGHDVCCAPEGASCTIGQTCCDGLVCPPITISATRSCRTCMEIGEPCDRPSQCCSGNCSGVGPPGLGVCL